MADIEAGKKKGKDKNTAAGDESITNGAEPAQASVRDLVKNLGAAFDVFGDDTPAARGDDTPATESSDAPAAEPEASASEMSAAPQVSEESEAEAPSEQAEPVAEKPRAKKSRGGGKRKRHSEPIEWSQEASNLDFIEEKPAIETEAAEDDGLSAFEALARRVAATVSRNQNTDEGETDLADDKSSEEINASEMIAAELNESEGPEEVSFEGGESFDSNEIIAEGESILAAPTEENLDVAEEVAENLAEALQGEGEEFSLAIQVDGEAVGLNAIPNGEASPESMFIASDDATQMGFSALQTPIEGESIEFGAGAAAAEPEAEEDSAQNDADSAPTEFIEADQVVSIIESLLFATDKPVSIATIKQMFKGSNVRTKDIARAMDTLASEYASPTRGVTLEDINGGYQLRTKSDNADYLRRLQKVRPFRLSGPALEVMAIVAYKQPITKHEVDEIRGVESGHLLRALMERGLINFGGKSDLPGKPMTYGSTRKFLETFGLRNLKELPTLGEIDELLPEGIGEETEKETLSDLTERMSTEFTGGYSEGEDELQKINDQLQEIDTTSEFFEQEKVRERERRDRERAQDIRERLVMGDNVEEKDKRWLDRYEAKLVAQEAAAQAGTPIVVSADEMDAETPITDQLEALSQETQNAVIASETEEGSEEGVESFEASEKDEDELFEDDDLSVNPDYSEDSDFDKDGEI